MMDEQLSFDAMAHAAAALWQLNPAGLQLVSRRAHLVYRGYLAGTPVYLRLTNPTLRSFVETQAECDFLAHLEEQAVAVAIPLRSDRGRHVETVSETIAVETDPEQSWSAVVFTEAPGREVIYGSPLWSPAFVAAWGRALGRLHAASVAWRPVAGWARKQWDEDYWIHNARLLLPPDDTQVLQQFESVMAFLRNLPRTPDIYAMTHGDFAPQNFRYDPERGITVFDFSNAGFHWTLWDVATALSTGLRLPSEERQQFGTHLIRGYEAEYPAGLQMMEHLAWFLRLRVFYVYLSRLWWFGATPTPDQRITLAELRALVTEAMAWQERVEVGGWVE